MSFVFRYDSLLRLLRRQQQQAELQLLQATQRMQRLRGIQQATVDAIDAMAWPAPAMPALPPRSTSAYPEKIDRLRQTTQAEIAEQDSVLLRMRSQLTAIRQRVVQLEALRAEHWQRWRDRQRRREEAARLDAVVRKHVFGTDPNRSATEREPAATERPAAASWQRWE